MSVPRIPLKSGNRQSRLNSSPPEGAALRKLKEEGKNLLLKRFFFSCSQPAHTVLETDSLNLKSAEWNTVALVTICDLFLTFVPNAVKFCYNKTQGHRISAMLGLNPSRSNMCR